MSPEDWYKSLPPVTRVWWSIAVGFTLLSTFGVINPYYMFLNSDLVFGKFQIWRLITCFLYFGPLSFPVIFSLVLLVRYCGLLEGQFGTHLNGTADLLVMLLFGMVNIWVLDYLFLGYGLYGMPLVFMCIYVWSRKDPFGEFSFYGFTFKQWHVPFLFTVAGMLYGGNPILDLVGIGIGHFYYFLLEIVPLNWGYRLLWTPDWMIQAVKMAQQRLVTGPPAQANTAMPRPHWQMGVGHRLG